MNLERVFTTIGDQVKEMYRSKQILHDTLSLVCCTIYFAPKVMFVEVTRNILIG